MTTSILIEPGWYVRLAYAKMTTWPKYAKLNIHLTFVNKAPIACCKVAGECFNSKCMWVRRKRSLSAGKATLSQSPTVISTCQYPSIAYKFEILLAFRRKQIHLITCGITTSPESSLHSSCTIRHEAKCSVLLRDEDRCGRLFHLAGHDNVLHEH